MRNTKDIKTKLGIDMKIMTMVEMVWSVTVFFFNAAQMPSSMPMGTDRMTEIIFKRMEYPIRDIMMTDAATLG